jgi:hypothetical protein
VYVEATAIETVNLEQWQFPLIRFKETSRVRLAELEAARTERRVKRANIERFLKTLARQENLITEFDEELWYVTVDCVKVYPDGRLKVVFRDGVGVSVESEK